MTKKLLALCLCMALAMSVMPTALPVAFGAEKCTVEFYNVHDNSLLDSFSGGESIYSKVSFAAPSDGDAVVVTALYNGDGTLKTAITEKATALTPNEKAEFTTKSIAVSGADSVRVFVWDNLTNLVPAAENYGEIKKTSPIGGSSAVNIAASNGVTTAEANLNAGSVRASVPVGTKVTGSTLAMTVTELPKSAGGIDTEENEVLLPLDIHVDGIAQDNTTPVIITVEKVASPGLNRGNLTLYHVEKGQAVKMTQVENLSELTAHNQFHYEPLTGTVTLAMATFSEVVVVSDTENAWNGTQATDFAGGNGTETDPYLIANADQLAYLGDRVSYKNETYGSKCYKLTADINIGGEENYNSKKIVFYPVGYNKLGTDTNKAGETKWYTYGGSFKGVFDGDGHKISGIYQNTWAMDGNYDNGYWNAAMGLFGYVNGGTVKNLTIDDFYSEGEFAPTGCIAAYAAGNATFENIAITNSHPQTYNTGVAGIVGWDNGGDTKEDASNFTFRNITIDDTNTISALWGSWDVAAAGLLGYLGEYSSANLENCNVSATIDVYNDVCGNYQYYWYRYCGMMIGTVDKTDKEGNLDLSNITATSCTAKFGDRHEYYYCEFEKNTQASYTDDYQFSRVPHSELNMDNIPVTCNHNHTANEDKQAVYIPFRQLFGGYGWGVDGVDLSEYVDKNGNKIQIAVVETSQEKFAKKFTGGFLYRVGNQNTVSLESLFKAINPANINQSGVYVTIDKVDENTNVSGKFTANTSEWTKGTIQFSGTGVVKVTIQDYDYCKPTELYLEVVDAYNRTTANFSGNSVLLQDVSTSSTLSTSGVVYGNGFTVNMENAPISEKNGAVFHLYDGAILKNIGIVGKEFTSVSMNVNDTNYGVSAVRAWGTVTIENSYISGCRSAVSVTGTELTIKDSVIANGIYSNVDFRSGILNLHNVTTVNEPHKVGDTTVVGLGVVGNMTASDGRQLNIYGDLTQYNWVSQADCANIKASGVESIFNSVFKDDKYAAMRYTYNGTSHVNTGILSLCSDFGENATSGAPTDYSGMNVTATISGVSINGYVWAPAKQATLTKDDMKYHDEIYEWNSSEQGTSFVPPSFNFTDSGLEVENGMVQVSYESGSSYILKSDTLSGIFNPTKYGQALSYKVTMNGEDCTGKDIVFNETESKIYTIKYVVTDNLIYDKMGKPTSNTYEVTKELKVFATVVDKGADAPTFTFYCGTNNSASAGTPHITQPAYSYASTIEQIGEAYYIMPNVNATSANKIDSKIVDGATIYYPIVDGINVRSGNSTDYDFTRYYPIFKAVEISDNGTEYSYSATKEMPATVAWVSASIDSGNGASALNDGFGLYNNQYLCKIQKKAGDAESGGTSVVQYSYTALDGNTYYYYIGYRFYDEDEGGLCITPDTLITLADGSQKEVQDLTGKEKLLVLNHETGKLESAPVAYIVNHDKTTANHKVTKLSLDDGKEIEIIGEHVFFDADLNKYVTLDETAEKYIGHSFVTKTENSVLKSKLTKVETYVKNTEAYEVVTYKHLTCFTNNILSASAYMDKLLNVFDINPKTLSYVPDNVNADIAKYGLYTYKDFGGIIEEKAFDLYNAKYLKIAVGKGYITWEDILSLVYVYKNLNIIPVNK